MINVPAATMLTAGSVATFSSTASAQTADTTAAPSSMPHAQGVVVGSKAYIQGHAYTRASVARTKVALWGKKERGAAARSARVAPVLPAGGISEAQARAITAAYPALTSLKLCWLTSEAQ